MPPTLKPPTPERPTWLAVAILLPFFAVALLTSPIWAGAFGALKLMGRIKAGLHSRRPLPRQPAIEPTPEPVHSPALKEAA